MAKVIKFGSITETEKGVLIFEKFIIDGEGSSDSKTAILEAVILRLTNDLKESRSLTNLKE